MPEIDLGQQAFSARTGKRTTSMAFIVETLVLLVFLVGSLAVITQLFASSASKAVESQDLERAVILAANTAERFSADPEGVEETTTAGDLAVNCAINTETLSYGTQYDATIIVYSSEGEVYRLQTSRYKPKSYRAVTQDFLGSTNESFGIDRSSQSAENQSTESNTDSTTDTGSDADTVSSTYSSTQSDTDSSTNKTVEVIE